MNYLLTLLFLTFLSFHGTSEVLPQKMHELFFQSDLIVEVKITHHTEHDYTLKVLDVLNKNTFGIQAGDFIKIKKEMNVVSSSETVRFQNIIDRQSGIAFLHKLEHAWSVHSITFFHDETATIRLYTEGCEVRGTSEELKSQIAEYFEEFSLKENGSVHGKRSSEAIESAGLGQLSLIQYASIYRSEFDLQTYSSIRCGERQESNED